MMTVCRRTPSRTGIITSWNVKRGDDSCPYSVDAEITRAKKYERRRIADPEMRTNVKIRDSADHHIPDGEMAGCPAAFRFALSAVTSLLSAVQRRSTSADVARARLHAST